MTEIEAVTYVSIFSIIFVIVAVSFYVLGLKRGKKHEHDNAWEGK